MRVRLGAFVLEERIAHGGSADVWRGVHTLPGRPDVQVAVKVLTGAHARDPAHRSAFRAEIHATARLDHPAIALVYDHGVIDAATAAAANGALPVDSPYLVLEYASQGTLSRFRRPLPWSRVQPTLLAVLDALAHAHARGVIHRDVKPGNVLVAGPQDQRPGLKLTDFGIAHAFDGASVRDRERERAGTLHYMAPEQCLGEWRDHGPWTDLYAVGCLAWRLTAGRPPYAGLTDAALSHAQVEAPLPPFGALSPVPPGFLDWLTRLLEKDPRRRFQRCADASFALLALGGVKSTGPEDPSLDLLRGPSLPETWSEDLLPTATAAAIDAVRRRASDVVHVRDTPPLPDRWEKRLAAPSGPVSGTGLALVGVRTIPMVGRRAERDRLWDALTAAHRQRTVRVVGLAGPAGIGKSRLTEAFVERAHEVGAAFVLRVAHDGSEAPTEPLRRMLERHFVTWGLSREATRERVRRALAGLGADDPLEVASIVELLHPGTDPGGDGPTVRLKTPAERHAVVVRLVERLADARVVVVWLDDVQWGPDALAFAEALRRRGETVAIPVVLLMTMRTGPDTPDAIAAAWDRLVGRDDADAIRLAPFDRRERRELVEELLGLDGALAVEVEERSAGNPAFAMAIVREWAERGDLVATPGGFRLRAGAEPPRPADLAAAWTARVEAVLAERPADAGWALERAAVLGHEVAAEEWALACVGLSPLSEPEERDRVLTAAIRAAVASPSPTGFVFAHGLAREALIRRAGERLVEHHLACAAMLEAREAEPGVPERIGRHLLDGGEPLQAIPHLRAGVRQRERAVGFADALALHERLATAYERLGLPPLDPERIRWLVERAQLRRGAGQLDLAASDATEALAQAREVRAADLERLALGALVRAERLLHGPERIGPRVDEWISLCRAASDDDGLAEALYERAMWLWARQEPERAEAALVAAMGLHESLGDDEGVATCLRRLADHDKNQGQLDRAADRYAAVLQIYERIGSLAGVGYVANGLGEVARRRGDLVEAERWYTRALERFDALGGLNTVIPRGNLALVHLAAGRWDAARARLAEALPLAERMGMRPLLGVLHTWVLPVAAHDAEWVAWDHHFLRARDTFVETGVVDEDGPEQLIAAGRIARVAGEEGRGVAALKLAITQLRQLGHSAQAEAIAAEVATPPGPGRA